MEEVLKALGEINNKLDALNKKFDAKEKEIETLKNENKALQLTIQLQEQRIEELEKQYREKKLIIHGIKEVTNENEETLEREIIKLMGTLGVEMKKEKDIVEVRRIGKQKDDRERPVLLEVMKNDKRREIFRKKKLLKGRNIWIVEDLPQQVRQQRRELTKIMQDEREKGNIAYFAYNKLVINGKIYEEHEEKNELTPETMKIYTPIQRKVNTRTHSQRTPDEDEDEQKKDKIPAVTRNRYGTKN